MNRLKNNFFNNKYTILILLSFHFLINLAIYFNTNTFYEISESGAVFDAYYSLTEGKSLLPISGYYFLTPAFIALFINKFIGGGLFPYFIFQIILSTFTVYIIYKIILHITKSIKQALIGIILILIYIEYHFLGSIFYNQLYEIFFAAIIIFLIILFSEENKAANLLLLGFSILIMLFASIFFRKTLLFIFTVFIFLLLFNFKNKTNIIKFSALALLCFITYLKFNPYVIYTNNLDESETIFWGHTFYGGLGGEVGFVFPENERRYNEKFAQYLTANNIDSVTPEVVKNFKANEVKTFITSQPHMWLFLLVKKVLYTFGSVPQKDGLLMLYKGKLKIPWTVSALILQLSYALILIMFLITVDLNIKKILQDKYKRIIYFFGLYLIGGICIFSAYQERYRPVIFLCFFIPVIAMNFDKFKIFLQKENRKEFIIKLILILILFAVWIYQAYEALYIYHDRYFKVVQ